jgi:hypothetical protein
MKQVEVFNGGEVSIGDELVETWIVIDISRGTSGCDVVVEKPMTGRRKSIYLPFNEDFSRLVEK